MKSSPKNGQTIQISTRKTLQLCIVLIVHAIALPTIAFCQVGGQGSTAMSVVIPAGVVASVATAIPASGGDSLWTIPVSAKSQSGNGTDRLSYALELTNKDSENVLGHYACHFDSEQAKCDISSDKEGPKKLGKPEHIEATVIISEL